MTDFHIVDLVSQRDAVRVHLAGKSGTQKLEWLASRGTLTKRTIIGGPVVHDFESMSGHTATFFVRDHELIFVADGYTFV